MATVADIQADIDAVREARRALAAGERVDEVWRDGRRLTKGKVTLDGLNTLLDVLKRELAEAQADASGQPRRRATALAWSN